MPGFHWGIYGECFYLKISDTGMPTYSYIHDTLVICNYNLYVDYIVASYISSFRFIISYITMTLTSEKAGNLQGMVVAIL